MSSSKDKGVKEFPIPNEKTASPLLGRNSSIIHSIFDLNHQIKQLYSLSHSSFLLLKKNVLQMKILTMTMTSTGKKCAYQMFQFLFLLSLNPDELLSSLSFLFSHRSENSKSEVSIDEEIEEVSIEGPDISDKVFFKNVPLLVLTLLVSEGV